MKMHGCCDNDIMVFKLVEALRGSALEYYNSLPAAARGQFSTLCTLDHDPKNVDEAVSLMRRFHGNEKALSV